MKQTVDALGHQDASVALLNALAAARGPGEDDIHLRFGMKMPCTDVEVELLVNGISVPFVETLADSLRALNDAFSRKVREEALRLVGSARLEELRQALDHAEWAIEVALEKAQLQK